MPGGPIPVSQSSAQDRGKYRPPLWSSAVLNLGHTLKGKDAEHRETRAGTEREETDEAREREAEKKAWLLAVGSGQASATVGL